MSRPTCKVCGRNNCRSKGRRKNGDRIFDSRCSSCHRKRLRGQSGPAQERQSWLASARGNGKPTVRPTCKDCGVKPVISKGKNRWRSRCNGCYNKNRGIVVHGPAGRRRRLPILHLKACWCEACGWLADDDCQLDLDHIDGNPDNNEPSNIQTLCANCHRIKTKEQDDYVNDHSEHGAGSGTEVQQIDMFSHFDA